MVEKTVSIDCESKFAALEASSLMKLQNKQKKPQLDFNAMALTAQSGLSKKARQRARKRARKSAEGVATNGEANVIHTSSPLSSEGNLPQSTTHDPPACKKRKFDEIDESQFEGMSKNQRKKARKALRARQAETQGNGVSQPMKPVPMQEVPITPSQPTQPTQPTQATANGTSASSHTQKNGWPKKPKVVDFRKGDVYVAPETQKRPVVQKKLSRQEMLVQCSKLPIFKEKQKLINTMSRVSTAVLAGETGSGKTTQIPKYLYQAGLHKNRTIAITQPRRVAAITVAQRVAEEMGVPLGSTVGYCVRFEDVTSDRTKIKYMTDGMLLREAILDPLMKRYSFVILDEAHERTIDTDVLFGVVKAAQKKREERSMLPLKIIIMSATMNMKGFSKYFGNAHTQVIKGRQYPITIKSTAEPLSDYIESCLVTVFQIHKTSAPEEGILVFLTGQEEIESVVKTLKSISKQLSSEFAHMDVHPLYASLPPAMQLNVFNPPAKGCRKVIISTNIAETSVTIHGIKHVIDSGMVKQKSFIPRTGLEVLKVEPVSKAMALQRTGRAGREGPGFSHRLYTEEAYNSLAENTTPEIKRCSLSSVVLKLLALGIKNVMDFDFMDRPSTDALKAAFDHLELLTAVTKENDKYKLSDIGLKMSAFPLEPGLARVLLAAHHNNCLEEVLTIVSLLSVVSFLFTPQNKREEANEAREKFRSSDGDHITMLNIYRAYKKSGASKVWCQKNFVNEKNMKHAIQIREQLKEIAVAQELTIKSCDTDTAAVRKSLIHGFYMNVAELRKDDKYETISNRKQVTIHPSSAFFMCRPKVVLYNELVETNKTYIRGLSVVDPEWLFEIAPNYFRYKLGRH